jgi:hypothetical protein
MDIWSQIPLIPEWIVNQRIFEIYHNHQTFVWEKKLYYEFITGVENIPFLYSLKNIFWMWFEFKSNSIGIKYTLCDETKEDIIIWKKVFGWCWKKE